MGNQDFDLVNNKIQVKSSPFKAMRYYYICVVYNNKSLSNQNQFLHNITMGEHYTNLRHNASAPSTMFGDATTFHLTLVSAENLHNPGEKIKVHAKIQLDNGAVKKIGKGVEGGTNPEWKFDEDYHITDSMRKNGGELVVRLYYKRHIVRKTLIGEVKIGVSRLFDMWRNSEKKAVMTYPAKVEPHGTLKISFKFR